MAVGLPEGQMGNSEVGHMNLGLVEQFIKTLLASTKRSANVPFLTMPP